VHEARPTIASTITASSIFVISFPPMIVPGLTSKCSL
jgi:hypothetical protein